MSTAVTTITLFTEDLAAAKDFYLAAFHLPVMYEDDDSCVFDFGNTLVNLLRVESAPDVVAPATIGAAGTARCLFTITVDDVDSRADQLRSSGIALLNGPIDRPWGVRTVAFGDPAGHIWELAQAI